MGCEEVPSLENINEELDPQFTWNKNSNKVQVKKKDYAEVFLFVNGLLEQIRRQNQPTSTTR